MLKLDTSMKNPLYLSAIDNGPTDNWDFHKKVTGDADCYIYCLDPMRPDNVLMIGVGHDDILQVRQLGLNSETVTQALQQSFDQFVTSGDDACPDGNTGDLVSFYAVLHEDFDHLMSKPMNLNRHFVVMFYDDGAQGKLLTTHPIVSEAEILDSETLIGFSHTVLMPRDKDDHPQFFKESKVVSIF